MKKSKHSLLLKVFALSGLLVLLASSAHAWRVSLPGGSRAETVVVDANGDVIAAGRAFYGGEVIKLSGTTGELIWQYNASHNQTEQGVGSIALDSHGDVFVLIGIQRSVTKISGVTGQRIWTGFIGGTIAGCQSRFNAIVVDHEDNVVAAGTAGCLFSVAKLDGATGAERWHYEREGYGKAVAVDPFGNVAAAGFMNRNFATVKLRGDNGTEIWQREINGAGNFTDVFEEANAVAMDTDGSVVAVGSTSNEIANFRDFTVARYRPDGTTHWIQKIDGQFLLLTGAGTLINQSNDFANAVAIDRDGGVIAAGSIQSDVDVPASSFPQAPEHFHVVKITRHGSLVWSKAAEEPVLDQEYLRGHAFSLSVNAYGNVVAGGMHGERFTLVKFWGRTGGRAWRRQIVATDPSDLGQVLRVSMDAASDVIAVGEIASQSAGASSQFTVVKLNRKDGLDYNGEAPPDNVPDVVVENAPYVYLYSDDQYRPGSPLTFISNSSLGWSHTAGCTDAPVAALGSIQPQRLGLGNGPNRRRPYAHQPILPNLACVHDSAVTFKSTDHTRPYDTNRQEDNGTPYSDIWSNSFYEREGFYLDLDDSDPTLRNGIGDELGNPIYPGAPVFYEYVEDDYIAYWFFYPYDRFDSVGIGVQQHEGDWERITVKLNSNGVPIKVVYHQHDGETEMDWPVIAKYDGSHPIVFSAKGSHASYPEAGEFETFCLGPLGCFHDHTNVGPAWLTWNDLANVEAQPWYGFGGAWGEVGDGPRGHFGQYFTGPLGPSRFKRSDESGDRPLFAW